ncbi:MAG: 2-ketoisovalerate ferredoxin oxidoreductase [Candidatus Altiarchaeales archaeon WOR_SM1_79]|nr:MAG: 2-ketoisovalerate ferredoxin oxidoreductase [Candidatus Altiarchaeales archaeon WOR_SM1_79]
MDSHQLSPGHRTCSGCGAATAIRTVLKAAGPNVIVCENTGCLEVTTSPYPETSWNVPWIHVAFENAAAVASGVEAALKTQGKDTKVIALGGDGSTFDIGFGSISGMLERFHDILYVCYDNEAYMNTGIQRSASTPYGAATTTSPAGSLSIGEDRPKKDMPLIVAAHHIPYVATASIGYINDLEKKVKKALAIKGPKYIQIHQPCCPGWGYKDHLTIEIAKLAVKCGMWMLYEIVDGEFKLNLKPKRVPVTDYLKMQKRFKHLKDENIEEIQRTVDERWKGFE